MKDTKLIVVGAFLTSLAAVFQIIPVIFSEALVLITMLSTLPIYIIAKMSPKIGIIGYIVATILIMFFSVHEGLFFLFTNGIVGLSLGSSHYYTDKKMIIFSISTVSLTIALSIMNFVIGIPVFGFKTGISIIMELCMLFLFSLVYSIVYFYISNVIFKMIDRRYKM